MKKIKYLNPPEIIINKFSKDKYGKRVFDLIRPWDFKSPIVAGIIGVPFDNTIAGRAGAREAPKTVRLAFRYNSTYNFDFDVDIQGMKVADIGDIATVHTSVIETHERIESVLSKIYKINIIPIIIGGDHSITFPAVKALCNNTTGKVGVISFDSHLDLRTYQGIHISSGTPFRRILEIEGNPVFRQKFSGNRFAWIS